MDNARHERLEPPSLTISMISTYPPTRCGVGRFSQSLAEAMLTTVPAPHIRVASIVGVDDRSHPAEVEVTFDPTSPVARRTAARRVNDSDAVILQHEYGLYGPDDGLGVLDLVDRIEAPLISVIHTVRSRPTSRQREIVETLSAAGALVVLSHVARHQLLSGYSVEPSAVYVIPHGSSWKPHSSPARPRRRLITWGLLGPGKGIERALHAMAEVRLPLSYDIVGQTHPNVLARSGQDYRHSLEQLVAELGLGERVRFLDRYMSDRSLEELVAASDLVVLPYDNDEQVCSGVLTDAVAAGRPVVATAFPHAREFSAQGCGRAVAHDSRSLAVAIEEMLTDDSAYEAAWAATARLSASLSWSRVAKSYLELAGGLRAYGVA